MTDQPVENHPCAGCGQLDDHPMIHVMGPYQAEGTIHLAPSFHYDCLPQEYGSLVASGDEHAVTRAAIEAAQNGIHGDELRSFILEQPTDNGDDTVEVRS